MEDLALVTVSLPLSWIRVWMVVCNTNCHPGFVFIINLSLYGRMSGMENTTTASQAAFLHGPQSVSGAMEGRSHTTSSIQDWPSRTRVWEEWVGMRYTMTAIWDWFHYFSSTGCEIKQKHQDVIASTIWSQPNPCSFIQGQKYELTRKRREMKSGTWEAKEPGHNSTPEKVTYLTSRR